MYLVAREFLGVGQSLAIAGLCAFAAPAWSTASRALWQHGPSMLLLALTLGLTARVHRDPRWMRFAGTPAALAFYVRPANAVWLAAITPLVFADRRRHLWAYWLGMLPVVALFSAIDLSIHGRLPAPYSFAQRGAAPGLSLLPSAEALAGNLISPARGLFVFVPLFLPSMYGACLKPKWPVARSLVLGRETRVPTRVPTALEKSMTRGLQVIGPPGQTKGIWRPRDIGEVTDSKWPSQTPPVSWRAPDTPFGG